MEIFDKDFCIPLGMKILLIGFKQIIHSDCFFNSKFLLKCMKFTKICAILQFYQT